MLSNIISCTGEKVTFTHNAKVDIFIIRFFSNKIPEVSVFKVVFKSSVFGDGQHIHGGVKKPGKFNSLFQVNPVRLFKIDDKSNLFQASKKLSCGTVKVGTPGFIYDAGSYPTKHDISVTGGSFSSYHNKFSLALTSILQQTRYGRPS